MIEQTEERLIDERITSRVKSWSRTAPAAAWSARSSAVESCRGLHQPSAIRGFEEHQHHRLMCARKSVVVMIGQKSILLEKYRLSCGLPLLPVPEGHFLRHAERPGSCRIVTQPMTPDEDRYEVRRAGVPQRSGGARRIAGAKTEARGNRPGRLRAFPHRARVRTLARCWGPEPGLANEPDGY